MSDGSYKKGDSITFLVKHKPFIDLSLPPSSNEYRDATCITFAIYDSTEKETLVFTDSMKRVPNRNGWYYYRYQTARDMLSGLYTVIFTSVTRIDGQDFNTRNVQQFRLMDDQF